MENLSIEIFSEHLENEDKYKCIQIVLEQLKNKQMSIVEIYTKILAPSLNKMRCNLDDKGVCIWQEHIRTAIVRSIIENSYIYLVQEKKKKNMTEKNKKVVVGCPDGEYHEIGARMAADFFDLNGFGVIFVGSSTPALEFGKVIKALKPEYIAISVTNFYNVVSAKKTIDHIREINSYDLKIIVGGNAFIDKSHLYKDIGADYCLQTFDDIAVFAREVD